MIKGKDSMSNQYTGKQNHMVIPPCSTGKFRHHQTPRSELQQGQAELIAPKILTGDCCHPRISTLYLHSGKQWVLGGDWPVKSKI